MRCKYCNYEMRDTEEFCPRCGMYVEYNSGLYEESAPDGHICPICGAVVVKDAIFCKCGACLKIEDDSVANENTSNTSDKEKFEPTVEERGTKYDGETEEDGVLSKVSRGVVIKSALMYEVIGLIFAYMLATDVKVIMLSRVSIIRFGMSFKTISRLPNNLVFLLSCSVCVACALTLIKFRVKSQRLKISLRSAVMGIILAVFIIFFCLAVFRSPMGTGKLYWFFDWLFILSVIVACGMIAGCILTGGRSMSLNVATVTFSASLIISFMFPAASVMRMLDGIIGRVMSKYYGFLIGPVPWIITAVMVTAIVTLLAAKLRKK